ncbi:prepilin-type N-terminal cleavage/methylation domain-containing protein [Heliobacterium gestii]|uniref:Prepilin-type N-terminal cleavage/methylation domain-containing protein n=1 Tax=Heliomicrobium gestii TaxID=2699 RepID=A0A845LKA8_HELGE|nr:prepilin-type N-terminal cleavage/methylation domain-containing protein [Heliomicrobium gestii]MBM7867892.1 prepilin-type N-terminal cleavage/methylation domain-containing protein [Heliomicrobium gestii]MZP43296.1 prepilin-type N-terminal cleavage/methylation domain-containing protein [Heliomicrobium gestii]
MLEFWQKKMKQAREQKGFSLIELMIVVAIIGVLFAVLVPRLGNTTDRARAAGVRNDFKAFETAIRSYYIEHNNTLPTATQISTDKVLMNGRYLDREITDTIDPWGTNAYAYTASLPATTGFTPAVSGSPTTGITIGCTNTSAAVATAANRTNFQMIIYVDPANNNALATSYNGF